MTLGFAEVVMPGRSYTDYVNYSLPLFVVMGVVFAGLGTAVATYHDLHSGMDARLRTLPMARSAPLLGRVAADAVRNLATAVLVAAAGFALGFRFEAGAGRAVAFFVVPVVFGFAIAWFMVAVAILSSSAETAISVINALLLVLSFLSSGFVPVGELASWAQPLAEVNPLSSVIDAMRALAHGGALAEPLLRTLAWTVGLTAVFGTLAVRGYRRGPAGGGR
jgi:ABC transporter DrrB family efflux protein